MLEIALVLLTINDAGHVRMAVSHAENTEASLDQAETAGGMLEDFGVHVVGARCGALDLNMTEFRHGASVEEEVNHYHVTLLGEDLGGGFTLVPVAADGTCRAPARGQSYCMVSAQPVLAGGAGG